MSKKYLHECPRACVECFRAVTFGVAGFRDDARVCASSEQGGEKIQVEVGNPFDTLGVT
jgi:hypothetical protein